MATLTFRCRGEGLGLLTASDSQDWPFPSGAVCLVPGGLSLFLWDLERGAWGLVKRAFQKSGGKASRVWVGRAQGLCCGFLWAGGAVSAS